MIKERIIGMLCGICILLLACSEQEENNSVVNNAIMGKDKVDVCLNLSLTPALGIEGNTDYRPMSTRASGDIKALIVNAYKCVVMKEIGGVWYVDMVIEPKLLENPKEGDIVERVNNYYVGVRDGMEFAPLQLTLRPGHYRVLAVLNSREVAWNPALVPGAVVKEGEANAAYAYTYQYQSLNYFGKRRVNLEIFAGTAEFTVEKTSDLHSQPIINGDKQINFIRRIMQMRFLLKDYTSKDGIYFPSTQFTVFATLKSDPNKFFCDGLDCWGNAYYNSKSPTKEIEICTQTYSGWHIADNGSKYLMTAMNVTIHSPFLFTDEANPVPYSLEDIKITGQSGEMSYFYKFPITGLIFKNNTIEQIVFKTTDEYIAQGSGLAHLEYLDEEQNTFLFDSYYECNIP